MPPSDFPENPGRVLASDEATADAAFGILYRELRRMARYHLSRERAGHTLQATGLVHEAYLKLAGARGLRFRDRAHFLQIASRAMRRILVDHARRRRAFKRQSGGPVISLDESLTISVQHVNSHLVDLDAALARLEQEEPEKATVVEMRFFGGMTEVEIAGVLNVTPRTVRRYWAYAQARLFEEMTRP